MAERSPQIGTTEIAFRNRSYKLEYFVREGAKGTIFFVHGLGGSKENFWDALKSKPLVGYRLIALDNPGTGNSTYYDDDHLQIDDLVEVTKQFIEVMTLKNFILVGASMGGLITLHYLREHLRNVKAYINIEGNLMPEDCMFSNKVVRNNLDHFKSHIFSQTIREMKTYGNPGYHIIANNLELNTNVISYFNYSFQTVKYSSTGELLHQFINLDIPRLFIYGDKNKGLSYLSRLNGGGVQLKMISDSNHFIFYDNPKALYEAIGGFVNQL